MVKNNLKKGFTLIEVMIVIAIIAILTAIAIPAYGQYKIRANRVDVQAEMLRIAQQLQGYYLLNRNFTDASLTIGGYNNNAMYPNNAEQAQYSLNLTIDADGQGWVLKAIPVSNFQIGNGVVCLNDLGQKYWMKGQMNCLLSAVSSWDGR